MYVCCMWVSVCMYVWGEGKIFVSACLHTLATNRSVKTSLAVCADSIFSPLSPLPSIYFPFRLTPSFRTCSETFTPWFCPCDIFFPLLSPMTAVFPTHSSVLYSPNMLLDNAHSPTPSTPCFPLLPPPLLSIPPFLLGSGVSNQCLSCLIPPRCCAAVCVCLRSPLYTCHA